MMFGGPCNSSGSRVSYTLFLPACLRVIQANTFCMSISTPGIMFILVICNERVGKTCLRCVTWHTPKNMKRDTANCLAVGCHLQMAVVSSVPDMIQSDELLRLQTLTGLLQTTIVKWHYYRAITHCCTRAVCRMSRASGTFRQSWDETAECITR
jgi:hypothetical protein